MPYTSIMVYQSLDGGNESRLDIAVDLAKRFGARLIGIAGCAVYPPAYANNAFAAGIVNELRSQTEGRLKEAADLFRAKTEGRVRTAEWRQALANPTPYVARESRAADLLITGTMRDGGPIDPFTELDPAQLIMNAGRPVLVVPPQAEAFSAANVLVAWKDTREARRAVLDALPLLQAASAVTVAEIADKEEIRTAARSSEDVAAWLQLHGVCATAPAVASSGKPFEVLQRLLSQYTADLIVAGAYGHSRLQEWVFGGVTRDLLTKSKCCCLFSH